MSAEDIKKREDLVELSQIDTINYFTVLRDDKIEQLVDFLKKNEVHFSKTDDTTSVDLLNEINELNKNITLTEDALLVYNKVKFQ